MEINKVYQGDCLDVMKSFPDNCIDAIVTDPPYGLKFMGKKWDYDVPKVEIWQEVLRVLKPGGHALVACGTRTQHRMACNLEDAGFEIRDSITELFESNRNINQFYEGLNEEQKRAFIKVLDENNFLGSFLWCYGSGFPKSLNIGKAVDKIQGNEREVIGEQKALGNARGKGAAGHYANGISSLTNGEYEIVKESWKVDKGSSEWEGWGTGLKPAVELWTLCRKPISENTIAENIIKWGTGGINIDGCRVEHNEKASIVTRTVKDNFFVGKQSITKPELHTGRFPANLIHDGSEEVLEVFARAGESKSTGGRTIVRSGGGNVGSGKLSEKSWSNENPGFLDQGTPARFFYCPKASKSERNMGCESLPKGNNHSTVKPLALMEYLVKLISPENSIVLDPFLGSGTTGIACVNLNRNYIGIDKEQEYIEIAEARIKEAELRISEKLF